MTRCCMRVYICPSSGEDECPVHGGFDVCCDDPTCPGYAANMEPDSGWRYKYWDYE